MLHYVATQRVPQIIRPIRKSRVLRRVRVTIMLGSLDLYKIVREALDGECDPRTFQIRTKAPASYDLLRYGGPLSSGSLSDIVHGGVQGRKESDSRQRPVNPRLSRL